MTYSITITDKKDTIQMVVGEDGRATVMMTGNPYSRIHVVGTEGVKHAQDGPVTGIDLPPLGEGGQNLPAHLGGPAQLYWGVLSKHGIYENRPIWLQLVDGALRVTYRAMFTVDVVGSETYTVYKYGGDWRYRKERN